MTEKFDPYYTWLGIPPDEQPADFYRLLGIRRFEENSDVIANAADARMGFVRGFQTGARSALSQQLLNELSAAKLCLLDSRKRAQYDAQLRAGEFELDGSALLPIDVVPPTPPVGPSYVPPSTHAPTVPWAGMSMAAPATPVPSPGALLTADPIQPVTLHVRRRLHHPTTHSLSYSTLFVLGMAVVTIAAAVVYRFHFGGGIQFVRVDDVARGGNAVAVASGTASVPSGASSARGTVSSRTQRTTAPIRARSKYQSRNSSRASQSMPNPADGSMADNAGGASGSEFDLSSESARKGTSTDASVPMGRTGLADLVGKTDAGGSEGTARSDALPAKPDASSPAGQPTATGGGTGPAGTGAAGTGAAGADTDATVPSGSAPSETAPSGTAALGKDGKRGAPTDAERAAKLAQVMQIYKQEFAEAKRADAKAALAQQLLKKANATADDPVGQFVLWELARDLAADSGHLGDALAAIDELAAVFDVAAWKMRTDVVERVQNVFAGSSQAPAMLRVRMIDDALRTAELAWGEDRYDEAEKIANIALQQSHSRAIIDVEVRRSAKERGDAILAICRQWRDVQRSLARLGADPDDAAANHVVGSFRCFQRNEWQTGLPLLAKSDHVKLAEAAKLDFSVADGNAAGQLQVALAWEEAAEGTSPEVRRDYLSRAVHWFHAATKSGLTGLDQELANKRLEVLRTVVPDPHPTDTVTSFSGSATTVHPGMIGRVFASGQELDVLVIYQPGHPISASVIQQIQRESKATGPLRIDLAGIVAVENGSRLAAMHEGGGATAMHRLVVGNNRGSQIDAAHPSDRPNLTTPAGRLPVVWQLNGLDGKARTQLTFTDSRTQQSPKVFYTKQMLGALRPTLSSKKGEFRKEYRLDGP